MNPKVAIRRTLIGMASRLGLEVRRVRQDLPPADSVCLNIGSGAQKIPGFINLDVPSTHYGIARDDFIPYDIRKDPLPFDAGSVDLIYCSHVIEHVEAKHVENLLCESARVLKPGGVLRISTPDAEFLWAVSSFPNDYWTWLSPLLESSGQSVGDLSGPQMLLRMLCTPRFRAAVSNGESNVLNVKGPIIDIQQLDAITDGVTWELDSIGDHISWWSYQKINGIAAPLFSVVLRSKFGGSVSPVMRGSRFDQTNPVMSLYVECIK